MNMQENIMSFFGICFGLQLSLIEYARNVLGYSNANSKELDENINAIN